MTNWIVPLARAVPALVLAVVVTFSADHSPTLGLAVFAAFALVTGAVIAVFAGRGPRGTPRSVQLAQGVISVLLGIVALTLISGGLLALIWLVSVFGVVTGFLELFLGVRARSTHASARDWMFVGAITIVLAIAVLIVPPDLAQHFTGPDGVARELTASVVIVGMLGAYWAVIGVYLVIAGLSLKWTDPATPQKETK